MRGPVLRLPRTCLCRYTHTFPSQPLPSHARTLGRELYRYLPNKTLQLLKYGLSSPCQFTHIVKTDDDVYLRWVDRRRTGWRVCS